MTRVLVTGAAGFVGRQALAALAATGVEVHGLSRHEPPDGLADLAVWHLGDLLAPDCAPALLDAVRPSHLLHLAWYAEPGRFWDAPENIAWVEASLRLWRAFSAVDGRRWVGSGSCAEYSWEGDGVRVEEGTPLRPSTLYGAAKSATWQVVEAAGQMSSAWGRLFFLYGPHEHPQRLVPAVARPLLEGRPAPCSHGRQVRDFMHVEDVGAAFVALLFSEVTGAVNVASGEPVEVARLIDLIGELTGRDDLLARGAVAIRKGEPEKLVADVRRLRAEVGFAPSISLRDGLERTIDWWR